MVDVMANNIYFFLGGKGGGEEEKMNKEKLEK